MGFKLGTSKNEDEFSDLNEINIIPLVDVMLVLLIIFMVTAPLSIGGIKVELPISKVKSSSMDEDRVILSISQAGEFFLESTKISANQLNERIETIFSNRSKKEIFIRADRSVPYGKVVDAMTAAKLAGVNKISMLTKNQEQALRK